MFWKVKILGMIFFVQISCLSPRVPRSDSLSALDSLPTELQLPSVLGDHMVFQEGRPITIWGVAKPLTEVEVTFGPSDQDDSRDQKVTTAQSNGEWKVSFPARKADFTELQIEVKSLNKKIQVRDVLVGEVWLAGGQSNMELNVRDSLYADSLLKEAKDPSIRIFNQDHVGPKFGARPSKTPVFSNEGGFWSLGSDQKSVARSSAVSFVFAKTLAERWRSIGQRKPVGILNAALGNSPAASWLSREDLLGTPELKALYPPAWQESPSPGSSHAYLQATAAFNHKIFPLRHLALRGVIFSQGESNVGDETKARLYRKTLVKLVQSWRRLWNNQEIVFIFTTLPAAASPCSSPERLDEEAFTREAQEQATEDLPLTLAIPVHDVEPTWDYGDWPYKHPIHPLGKNLVGSRLAEAAWGLGYQKTQNYAPPKMRQTELKQDSLVVTFSESGGSLQVLPKGKSLRGFALAGSDRVYYPATARILDGNRVEVRSPKVPAPLSVTYGFTQLNHGANLYGAKMPALPFRSDKSPATYLRIKPFYPFETELQTHSLGSGTQSKVEQNPEASRGLFRRLVANGQGGSVTFSLSVPHDGVYDLDLLTIVNKEDRSLNASVDEALPVTIDLGASSSAQWKELSVYRKINLKKGVRQFKLGFNSTSMMDGATTLDLDQIRLRPTCPGHPSLARDWL